MSQPLPTEGFAWLSEDEFDGLDISNIPNDGEEGYILEVDLEYPPELHNDFPLAPQKMKVMDEMLSPYCQELKEELGLKNLPSRNWYLTYVTREDTSYIIRI